MVDIIMATYNGEMYISEQIDSILNQTYKNFKLYIRDDGSSDNTIEIIKKYVNLYPNKIVLVEDNKANLGSIGNFNELISYSKNKYCMFCDQDDIWLNNKIEITLKEMKNLELNHGQNTPILIHTDLKVVNNELEIIEESFWNYTGINPNLNTYNRLLVMNTVTGCTMMINDSLKQIIGHIPKECEMHDWWIAIVASVTGKIGVLNEQTILYRQHNNNVAGAVSKNGYANKIRKIFELKNKYNNQIEQAKLFREKYNSKMSEENKIISNNFINIKQNSLIKRKLRLVKYKFYPHSKLGILSTIIFI